MCELDAYLRVIQLFVVFETLLLVLDMEVVIKSAASAASRKTKIQESRGASGRRLGFRTARTARLPWIPGFWSSGRLR